MELAVGKSTEETEVERGKGMSVENDKMGTEDKKRIKKRGKGKKKERR